MTKSSPIRSASKSTSARRTRSGGSSSFAVWLIAGSILIVTLVVALIMFSSRTVTAPTATLAVPDRWVNRTTLGNPDAKVTVQAWEDFLCPHCKRWNAEVQPKLLDDYIKTGKVRLEFHQFPLQSHDPGATMAALSSECAADQNAFWPYHDKLFEVPEQDQAGYTMEKLTGYANELHIDQKKFTQCMSSLQHQAEVTESLKQVAALGLNSTPSVLVNGQQIANPFDYAALKAQIDKLAK
jgi:protein-disulfide isomerase